MLGKPVEFARDCIGTDAEAKSNALPNGGVLLLENVRYYPQEEANDPEFSKKLAALCDGLFVCDAFGSAHRAHASVVGITQYVKQAAAGLLMEKELAYMGKAISNPERPFVAVLGGAKVSDKIEVVQNMMKLADAVLIGGAMAYTLLKSQGVATGKSLVENDKLDLAKSLVAEAKAKKFKLLLPVDHVLAQSPDSTATETADIAQTPDNMMGLDIGPKTVQLFSKEIAGGEDDCVERADGYVRKTTVRAGHVGNSESRRGGDAGRGDFDCRRRRFSGGCRTVGCGEADFAHFDGRRRFARISGGRKAAGRRGADQRSSEGRVTWGFLRDVR